MSHQKSRSLRPWHVPALTGFLLVWVLLLQRNLHPPILLPSSYAACMRRVVTQSQMRIEKSELSCTFIVWNTQENAPENTLLNECERLGGWSIRNVEGASEEILDYCRLTFYNPNFEFPQDYDGCIAGKGRDAATALPRCLVTIEPRYAYDKGTAMELLNKCRALGGTYDSKQPSCSLWFLEDFFLKK